MAAVSGQLERDATPFVAFSHLFGGPAVNPDSVNGGGVEMDSGDLNDLQERLKAAGIPPELLPLIVQVIGGTPKAPEQNTSADGGKAAQMSRLAEVAKKKLSDAVTDAKKDLELKERAFAAFSAGVNGSQPQLNEMTLGMLKHMRVTSPRVYERLTGRSAV
jgi:hypothetical protein